jgi:hypothetical protein
MTKIQCDRQVQQVQRFSGGIATKTSIRFLPDLLCKQGGESPYCATCFDPMSARSSVVGCFSPTALSERQIPFSLPELLSRLYELLCELCHRLFQPSPQFSSQHLAVHYFSLPCHCLRKIDLFGRCPLFRNSCCRSFALQSCF